MTDRSQRPAWSLVQVTVLHAWTHAYGVALLPLYLPMARDLDLPGLDRATVLVTLMMAAYFGPSYAMGVLADRVGRKPLLVWGLVESAMGFLLLAGARSFGTAAAAVAFGDREEFAAQGQARYRCVRTGGELVPLPSLADMTDAEARAQRIQLIFPPS